MKIGTTVEGYGPPADFNAMIAQIVQAEADGFESLWLGAAKEPLITCAVAARETSSIEMMSAIVISYVRHPATLAQQATTTNAALDGRFVLGIGPASRPAVERLGYSYDRAAANMREYVSVVKSLVDDGSANFDGEFYRATDTTLAYPWRRPVPVLMSALGGAMLKAAGEVADGTVTWMVGVNALRDFVTPRITAAAASAGRAAPRIAVGLPVCVTDDAPAAREAVERQFANYGASPHYRRMIDMEGGSIGNVAVIGTENEVESRLRDLAAAGATHFYAFPFAEGSDTEKSLIRTRELVVSLKGKV
jgi:5,10-methylenetetrahydromethanopterin reductase